MPPTGNSATAFIYDVDVLKGKIMITYSWCVAVQWLVVMVTVF